MLLEIVIGEDCNRDIVTWDCKRRLSQEEIVTGDFVTKDCKRRLS